MKTSTQIVVQCHQPYELCFASLLHVLLMPGSPDHPSLASSMQFISFCKDKKNPPHRSGTHKPSRAQRTRTECALQATWTTTCVHCLDYLPCLLSCCDTCQQHLEQPVKCQLQEFLTHVRAAQRHGKHLLLSGQHFFWHAAAVLTDTFCDVSSSGTANAYGCTDKIVYGMLLQVSQTHFDM